MPNVTVDRLSMILAEIEVVVVCFSDYSWLIVENIQQDVDKFEHVHMRDMKLVEMHENSNSYD